MRRGTQTLIATCAVATGAGSTPSIGPTRTEADFAAHIAHPIETDGEAPWLFVVDQLHTHTADTLVRLVAERCGIGDA